MGGYHYRPTAQIRIRGEEIVNGEIGARTQTSDLQTQRLGISAEPYLTELQFIADGTGGADSVYSVSMTFHDSTFTTVEDALFPLKGGHRNIDFRWGYPSLNRWTVWRRARIIDITPGFTAGGQTITLSATVSGNAFAGFVKPYTFQGYNWADVLTEALKWMGYEEVYVEPTVDTLEISETSGNQPIKTYIKENVLPKLRSKAHDMGNYTWKEDDGVKVHLLPAFLVPKKLERVPWSFQTGHAISDQVVSFVPTYLSDALGGHISTGFVAEGVDRDSKRRIAEPINPTTKIETLSLTPSKTAIAPDPDNPRSMDFGARVPIDSDNIDEIRREAQALWEALAVTSNEATLNLHGSPDLINFKFQDFVYVDNMIRNPETKDIRRHWSSGRYQVQEVTHTIGLGYSIEAKLMRHAAKETAGTELTKDGKKLRDAADWTKSVKDVSKGPDVVDFLAAFHGAKDLAKKTGDSGEE